MQLALPTTGSMMTAAISPPISSNSAVAPSKSL